MIFKIIVGGFFTLIEGIINGQSLGGFDILAGGGSIEFLEMMGVASFFFPFDLLVFLFGLFGFSTVALLGWSFFEWVYKKIPGVS